MKKYILMFVSSLMLVSCLDTIILPDDKTVDEDFWKTKENVASMVNAAYSAMASEDVITRFIVWGDFRTDEFLRTSSADVSSTTQALDEIASVNMQTTNMYASWASLYTVINRCNIVLDRAAEVMELDPNYTQGDYQVDRSQMLALRSLCYFYLVRNFRDVPYIAESYMNSSQNMQVAQSSPAYVLERCIADLEEAAKTPIAARGYTTTNWRRVGWMTDDAINALLADIYLWRAAVTHSQADYDQCITYCDKVIESKRAQHVRGRDEVTEKAYPLADANRMYEALFISQNAEESIFEIQMNSNPAVWKYYYKYKSASGTGGEGWLKATPIFGPAASKYDASTSISGTTLYASSDLRYNAACYIPSTGEETYHVRKMVSQLPIISTGVVASRDNASDGLDCNYNIYRLTDVMLMKAEALIEKVDTTLESSAQLELLREPFTLIQEVNKRALYQENQGDSMTWTVFQRMTKDQFEQLVMQERLREFCFEGRRWYDLMRYNYRHISGIDYSRTLAELYDAGVTMVANYSEMLNLMTRSRGTEGNGVRAKMANEAYLYMPIPNSDIIVCPLLRQNPVYKNSNEYEKNY